MRVRSMTVATLTALALTTTGCEKLLATTFALSVVTQTPDLANAQNVDPSLIAALGSAVPPPATAAFVGVGQRDSVTSQSAPTGVTGATVSITYTSASTPSTVTVCDEGSGTYETTSLAGAPCPSTIAYVPDVSYTTDILTAADSYSFSVTAPAALDPLLVSFDPPLAAASNPALAPMREFTPSSDLKVSWTTNPSGKHVFVAVVRADFSGSFANYAQVGNASYWSAAQNPVWTNFPTSPMDVLDLLTNNAADSVIIPKTVFSQAGLYAVLVTLTERGAEPGNLSLGSGAMAGAGTPFVFIVQ